MPTPIKIVHNISHREYTLYGANAEMYVYLSSSGILDQLFTKEDLEKGILIKALGSNSPMERVAYGKVCIKSIWTQMIDMSFPPYFDLLAQFEFDRKFYSGYRDHVTHQLKVLLLGFYLMDQNSIIRNSLEEKFQNKNNIYQRWIMTALYHDLGYVFECGNPEEIDHAKPVFDLINIWERDPLYYYFESIRNTRILPAQRDRILSEIKWQPNKLNMFDDILFLDDQNNILSLIESKVISSKLGGGGTPLFKYLTYARSNKPPKSGRKQFIDHGIASACLLLYMGYREDMWRKQILELNKQSWIDNDTWSDLSKLEIKFRSIWECIKDSAAAISLHNIWPSVWNPNHAFSWQRANLTLHTFSIDLKETPLAYLLALCDTLQDWDRPRYSAPVAEPIDWPDDMQSQDIHLLIKDNRLLVCYPADIFAGMNVSDSRFNKLLVTLNEYTSYKSSGLEIVEVEIDKIEDVIKEMSWARKLLYNSKNISESPVREDKGVYKAYSFYTLGRQMANARIWKVSETYHLKGAQIFGRIGMKDWEARSLGRVAFNRLDQGNLPGCKEALEAAISIDTWQGIANYYWTIEHCIRGAGNQEILKYFVEVCVKGLHDTGFVDYDSKDISKDDKYLIIITGLINFFENLISKEIENGWPTWAMSDISRLYLLKASISYDNSEVFFKLAKEAFESCGLSSYAAWIDSKYLLVKASKENDIVKINGIMEEIISRSRLILQSPGGYRDIVKFSMILVTFYNKVMISILKNLSIDLAEIFDLVSQNSLLKEHLGYQKLSNEVIDIYKNALQNKTKLSEIKKVLLPNIKEFTSMLPFLEFDHTRNALVKLL